MVSDMYHENNSHSFRLGRIIKYGRKHILNVIVIHLDLIASIIFIYTTYLFVDIFYKCIMCYFFLVKSGGVLSELVHT